MKKKELLLEVYSEPMIQDLLKKGFLTKEMLVEFVLNEEDEEPEEEEVEPEESPSEPDSNIKDQIFTNLGKVWHRMTGKSAAEKIAQWGRAKIKEMPNDSKTKGVIEWLFAQNPLEIEKKLQQDLKIQRQTGEPSGAAKVYNIETLSMTLNVSISLGKRVLKLIDQIDARVGWKDPESGKVRREIPDEVLNIQTAGDADAEKAKKAKIQKYREEIDRIESILSLVEPQVEYNQETDKIQAPSEVETATIFTLSDLLVDEFEKLNKEQQQAVRERLGAAFIRKNAAKGLEDLKLGDNWDSIDALALNGIIKYHVNISKIEKQIKSAEEKVDAASTPVAQGQGNAMDILSEIFGISIKKSQIKEINVEDLFPEYTS